MTAVVLLGHGSRDPRASAAMREFASRLQSARPDDTVAVAFLDHNEPSLEQAVDALRSDERLVVVPMLLSTAFHAKSDVPAAVRALGGAREIITTPPVGTSSTLASEAASSLAGPMVFAFSGTSDAAARRDLEGMAEEIAAERGSPVCIGYVSQAEPTVAQAIAEIGARAVLSFTLFPGMFSDRIAEVAADAGIAATPPLYLHDALLHAVEQLLDEALA